jgi:hypothetical protein
VLHAVFGATEAVAGRNPSDDFDRYYEIARAPGRPYVDFAVEYPIGTLSLFRMLGWTATSRASFGMAVVAVNFAADAAIVLALAWGWGEAAAACFALASLPVIELLFDRTDLWSMAAATVAAAAWHRSRRSVAAVALALGASFKLWPLLFTPMLLTPEASTSGSPSQRPPGGPLPLRPLAVLGLTAVVLGGAAWLIGGYQGMLQVLTFRGARGWQIEGAVGSIMRLIWRTPIRLESGSWRTGEMQGATAILMFMLGAPVAFCSTWRGARRGTLGVGWLAGVSTLLTTSALFSAQFVGWLAPGAAIAWVERRRGLAWVAAVSIVLTRAFWTGYSRVLEGAPFALLLVVVRNLVVGGLALAALADLAGRGSNRG